MPHKKNPAASAKAVTRTGKWQGRFLANLAQTGNVTKACEAAPVARKTAYEHRKNDKQFAEGWDAAIDVAADTLEGEAWRRAYDGLLRKKFTKGGEPIIDPATGEQYVEREYDTTLLIFLLKAMRPEKFRERVQHTHDGSIGLRTPAEGEAAATALLDELRGRLGRDA